MNGCLKMTNEYQYPAEIFLNARRATFGAVEEAICRRALLRLLNGFDSLNAENERHLLRVALDDSWHPVEGGRFRTDAERRQFVDAIAARFQAINEDCRLLGYEPLFGDPRDVLASYFLRDCLMVTLPTEEAAAVLRERAQIASEFRTMEKSPTFGAIAGRFWHRSILRRYRRRMPRGSAPE